MFFFYTGSSHTKIYTLSLHDALPIWTDASPIGRLWFADGSVPRILVCAAAERSEEHTSELQSQSNLVCRLLLEKKNIGLDREKAIAAVDYWCGLLFRDGAAPPSAPGD